MRNLYPLIEGEVAFIKSTDEPVFVVTVEPERVFVRRALQTAEKGVNYVEEYFSPEELHTEKARLVKEMEFTKFSVETRDRYSENYQKQKTLAKIAPMTIPQADGNSGMSN